MPKVLILTLRTDKPEAELGLYEDEKQLAYVKWQAHLELSKTIHKKIKEILNKLSTSLEDIEGIVAYKGPGSFTGLRIGLGVANALAYAQDIPIVATAGENWLKNGIKDLLAGKNDKIVLPKYGSAPYTSKPHK